MTIADFNLVIAVVIAVLVAAISISHIRDHGFTHRTALLGVTVVVFAALNLLSASGSFVSGDADAIEAIRFAAAVCRGVVLVLLLAYVWHRWSD